jgi:hypothetical protein
MMGLVTQMGPAVSIRLDLSVSNQKDSDARFDARFRSVACSKALIPCSKCAGGSDKAALPESWQTCVVNRILFPCHPLVWLPIRLESWSLDVAIDP